MSSPLPLRAALPLLAFAAVLGAAFAAGPPPSPKQAAAPSAGPDFNREVRPILSGHCFKCHGPDDKQRAAGLRLDLAGGAYAKIASGKRAVVPGDPARSELIARIDATGDLQMPPAHANKPLSEAQKRVLRAWVASGAKYEAHWAFVAPKQAALPAVRNKAWVRNPVDAFVLARMEKAGLSPAPEADRYTLCRRVYLDLIGLPPTPEEADAFVADKRPDAYERLVDKLLASPRYGERWARPWLDLARYADTNGYEKDRPRSMWPYRDWVIRALNADLPFDQFTVRQLAGDMLPNATAADRVATGFHRNTMINEEGGIDPLEYRFHAMTDRVATTGTTWMGLTVGCAQCHTHKYDPIPHRDYYRLMALLDNADEPVMPVPDPEVARRRAEGEKEIARREATLAERFPLPRGPVTWAVRPMAVASAAGATPQGQPDGSVLLTGAAPDKDTYTVTLDAPAGDGEVTTVRLEALTDPSLGAQGPGRTPHGNFVLTEVSAARDGKVVKFARAQADFMQDGFPPANVLDGKPGTGWAIAGQGKWNVNRTLILDLAEPVSSGGKWTFTLAQQYGGGHTLGRFRLSLGTTPPDRDPRPAAERRREALEPALADWCRPLEANAVRWTALTPAKARADVPVLRVQPDGSVLSTSDITKRDVYEVDFAALPAGVTALRLEAIPDPRLPGGGPGRVYYEGSSGDFFLSEFTATAGGQPVKFARSVATTGNAAAAVDGDPLSGWTIGGGQTGRAHVAVFALDKPLAAGGPLSLKLLFERYYASALGRFRVSYTTDPRALQPVAALLPEVEEALATPAHSSAQNDAIFRAFLRAAPELAAERAEIDALRRALPALPTTLVFEERPADNPRATYLRHRGEFLQPAERVTPGVLSCLPPLPKGVKANRLAFARWLVSAENPLTARVTVNRQWAALWGAGLVRTVADFGYQGEPPTHPELLDWLAVHFAKPAEKGGLGWSMKRLHRLLVTSAAYRQSSRVTPQKRNADPENRLCARGPRVRLEAELVRDAALRASGLLSEKMYGPSVFPAQPAGVTTEGAYGPLAWNVSQGEDRHRRGLYTFAKRTAGYALFATFDAPSGEATCPRREVTNTPLQALSLLNDAVFVEAAQALGALVAARPGTPEVKAAYLLRRVLTRPAEPAEVRATVAFYAAQKARLARKELDPAPLAAPAPGGDPADRAAWTLAARAALNLDEAIVKR